MATANKSLYQPANGSYVGSWDQPNNANFGFIDAALGSVTTLDVTTGSQSLTSTPAALPSTTPAQTQCLIFNVINTLAANVVYTIPAGVGGYWIVNNQSVNSGGNTYTVKFAGSSGTGVIIPSGYVVTIYNDPNTNVTRFAAASTSAVDNLIPSGTAMLFAQAAAPTGWTKSTANNDKALRVVSGGSGGTAGGSTAFSSVFTSRTITTANMPSHTHGVNDPGHTHLVSEVYAGAFSGGSGALYRSANYSTSYNYLSSSSFTGISIQNSGSGTPMDFAVQYLDVIVCTKN